MHPENDLVVGPQTMNAVKPGGSVARGIAPTTVAIQAITTERTTCKEIERVFNIHELG